MITYTQPEVVLKLKAQLGEGAIWHPIDKKLYWVDIEGKLLHVFDPISQKDKAYDTDERIGTVVPVKSGGVLLALENGISHFDLESGQMKFIIDPEKDKPNNRFNDGKCDPLGNFWVGSMPLDEKDAVGYVYKISPDFSAQKMITEVTVSNGICWSQDCSTMYYIDSPTRKIVAYNFNKNDASISNPKVVVTVEDHLGFPDGMTIDANGMLWVALWGGAAVGCWNPITGKLIESIPLPALNVTSCAFGGENLNRLFITSARQGTTPEQLERYPNSGDVFVTEVNVSGVPACLFGQ